GRFRAERGVRPPGDVGQSGRSRPRAAADTSRQGQRAPSSLARSPAPSDRMLPGFGSSSMRSKSAGQYVSPSHGPPRALATKLEPAASPPAAAAAASASSSWARAAGSVYALKYGTYHSKKRRVSPVQTESRSSRALEQLLPRGAHSVDARPEAPVGTGQMREFVRDDGAKLIGREQGKVRQPEHEVVVRLEEATHRRNLRDAGVQLAVDQQRVHPRAADDAADLFDHREQLGCLRAIDRESLSRIDLHAQ